MSKDKTIIDFKNTKVERRVAPITIKKYQYTLAFVHDARIVETIGGVKKVEFVQKIGVEYIDSSVMLNDNAKIMELNNYLSTLLKFVNVRIFNTQLNGIIEVEESKENEKINE